MCPELVFKDGRYWCDLMRTKPELVKDMMMLGCGAPWNMFRRNVKERTKEDFKDYFDNGMIPDMIRHKNGDVAQ